MPNTTLGEAAPTATLGDATRSKIPEGVRSVQVPNTPKNIRNEIVPVVKRQSVKHFLLCLEDRFSDGLR
ncbi:MAG: hypothetical protein V7K97_16580 [Nostoc sp.]|uniref:hypothetical protein n=1 Tax=Nostoc sp. TaxID=1180 RepID=UPI002FF7A546